jgi:hypothetical protein
MLGANHHSDIMKLHVKLELVQWTMCVSSSRIHLSNITDIQVVAVGHVKYPSRLQNMLVSYGVTIWAMMRTVLEVHVAQEHRVVKRGSRRRGRWFLPEQA